MVGHPRGGGVARGAEGTLDRVGAVGARVQVLDGDEREVSATVKIELIAAAELTILMLFELMKLRSQSSQ